MSAARGRHGLTRERTRHQRGVVGSPRIPVGSRFSPRTERAVEREQARYSVSRSWVIARAVAFALNVDEEDEDYR